MGNLPARCNQCGHVFRSPINIGDGVRGTTIKNVSSRCPKCGAGASVVDGKFDVDAAGRFAQQSGPPVDVRIFAELGLILIQAKEENRSPQEIVERVEPHSPGLAKRFQKVLDDPQAFAILLGALLALTGMVAVAAINNSSPRQTTVNKIIQNNVTIIQQYNRHTPRQQLREKLHKLRETRTELPAWIGKELQSDGS